MTSERIMTDFQTLAVVIHKKDSGCGSNCPVLSYKV